MLNNLAGRRKRHRLDRVTDAVLEDGSPTNHMSSNQDDDDETKLRQFSAPPVLQPGEDAYQDLLSLWLNWAAERGYNFVINS